MLKWWNGGHQSFVISLPWGCAASKSLFAEVNLSKEMFFLVVLSNKPNNLTSCCLLTKTNKANSGMKSNQRFWCAIGWSWTLFYYDMLFLFVLGLVYFGNIFLLLWKWFRHGFYGGKKNKYNYLLICTPSPVAHPEAFYSLKNLKGLKIYSLFYLLGKKNPFALFCTPQNNVGEVKKKKAQLPALLRVHLTCLAIFPFQTCYQGCLGTDCAGGNKAWTTAAEKHNSTPKFLPSVCIFHLGLEREWILINQIFQTGSCRFWRCTRCLTAQLPL